MKFLVISLAGIGDTLFGTPLIHELRVNFPRAQIDALVMWRGSKDLLEGNPHLDSIFQHNFITVGWSRSLRFLTRLRRQKYDASFNTHPQSRIHYRVVARFVDAGLRISHRYDNARILDNLLVNRVIPQDYHRHAIDNNLSLLACIKAKPMLRDHDYEVYLSAEESQWANDVVEQHKLHGRLCIGIHVGSGGTKNLAMRRWPLENYIELIQRLNQTHPEIAVLLFGGPDERQENQRILTRTDSERVINPQTTSLRHAAALLQICSAFLSVDTAFMHLAAAVKIPTQFVIESPTWNTPIQPYNNPFTLIKNPGVGGRNLSYYRYDGGGIKASPEELLRCMKSVTVESVLATLEAKLFSKL